MTKVTSDMVSDITHSRKTNVMTVTYKKGGSRYAYKGVTRYNRDQVVKGVVNGSVGETMHDRILGKFDFDRIG